MNVKNNPNLNSILITETNELAKQNEHLKQLLEKKHQESTFFQAILENDNFAIWGVDNNFNLLFFNELGHHNFLRPLLKRNFEKGAYLFNSLQENYTFINHTTNYDRALSGKSFVIESQIINYQQKVFWGEFTFQPMYDEDKIIGVMVIAQDITKRKFQEEKLVDDNDSKESILGIVAHDLRTPINNIFGFASLLETWLAESPRTNVEEANDFLSYIIKSCEIANNLIADLLEITKMESKSYQLEAFPINLSDLLQSCIQRQQFNLDKKGIKVLFKAEEALLVMANDNKLSRVFDNLLSNAIKFSYANNNIEIDIINKGCKALISVKDYGIGMNENAQSKLFDKFSMIRKKGTQGEKSTGLGMAIVKQIIQLHKGKIYVQSKENEGTTMFIELPLITNSDKIQVH